MQGSLFRQEDAEVSFHSPSATTNPHIHRQNKWQSRLTSAMDGQRHRSQRDGLYQQRRYAAQTTRTASLQDIRCWSKGLLPLLHRHQTPEERKLYLLPWQDAGETQREDAPWRGAGAYEKINNEIYESEDGKTLSSDSLIYKTLHFLSIIVPNVRQKRYLCKKLLIWIWV